MHVDSTRDLLMEEEKHINWTLQLIKMCGVQITRLIKIFINFIQIERPEGVEVAGDGDNIRCKLEVIKFF